MARNPDRDPNAELLGHLGVALYAHPERSGLPCIEGVESRLLEPFPAETLLLSMDRLQRWTWTRRGGTRGDFLALFPDPDGDATWIVAIESKGSAGDGFVDGTGQARAAERKLRERFGGPSRAPERRELLRCIAEESFRTATGVANEIMRRTAHGKLRFGAVCVSTARHGVADPLCKTSGGTLWIRLGGAGGFERLCGVG